MNSGHISCRTIALKLRASGASHLTVLLCLVVALARTAMANPVSIQDPSFDNRSLSSGGTSNTLTPWQETGGTGNANGWIARVSGFAGDGPNHLGMNLNHNVWQDLGVTYQANMRYTLTVAVGNRSGFTQTGNLSQFQLAASDGTIFATGTFDANSITAGTFADARPLVFQTGASSNAIGKTIRIVLQARGAGRSHFDRIRLTAVSTILPQTITFAELPTMTAGDPPVTLAATATSGLPVSYSSSNPAIASVSGSQLTAHAGGNVTITANQEGNTGFLPADPVSRTLTVYRADRDPQTINFAQPPTQTFGNRPLTLSASASSGLPVAFASSNPAVAQVSGNTITLTGPGSAVITATQAGGIDHLPATPVQRTLVVNAASGGLSFNPSSLGITVRSGETGTAPLALENSTSGQIDWRLLALDAQGRTSGLEGQLDAIINSGDTLNGPLPLRFDFTGGEAGTTSLNGNPSGTTGILSQGNRLLTNLGGPLTYTNDSVAASTVLGPQGRYFTRKLPGLFVFGAETDGIEWFEVAGSLVYGSSKQSSAFRVNHNGRWWSAFVVNHVDYWKTINHLVLVDQEGLQQTLGNTSSQQQRITGLSGKRRIYQFLYITTSTSVQPQSVFEALASRFLGLLPEFGSRMTFNPTDGSSPASGATASIAGFDAFGMAEGTYLGTVRAQAPAGGALASAPVSVTVTAPRIQVPAPVEREMFPGQVPLTLELPLTSNLPEAQSWTAGLSSPAAWLTVENPSGTTPEPLRLRLDPAGLATGTYSSVVTINSGPAIYQIPISLRVRELAIGKLVADPARPLVYALHKNGLNEGTLLVINSISRRILHAVPTGKDPTDCDLSEDGSKLWVINSKDPSLMAVSTSTWQVIETIPLTQFTIRDRSAGNPGAHVKCGKGSIVYYVDDQWGPRLRVFDTATRAVLQTFSAETGTSPDTSNNFGYGDIALNPKRSRLFGWRQYGDSAGVTGSHIVRFDIKADGTLEKFAKSANINTSNFDRVPYDTPVIFSRDGTRLIIKDRVINQNNLDTHPILYPDEIYSITPGGEVAVGSAAIYAGEGGEILHNLPVTSTVQTVLPDYSAWVYFNSTTKSLGWLDLPGTLGPAKLGLELTPADGSTVAQPSRLKWLPVTGITRYQVYLGINRTDVENATTASAVYLGMANGNEMALAGGLALGQTYYWRAVPIGADDVPLGGSTIYSFSVSGMTFSRSSIAAETVQGVTTHLETIQLESAVPQAWTATESTAWIKSVTAAGSTPGALTVEIDASTLAAGLYQGSVTVTGAGSQVVVPVSLKVHAPNFVIADADLDLPYVYLVSQTDVSSSQPSFLLRLNTTTDKIESAIPCGTGVTDLAVHYLENRIYLTNWKTGVLRAFDRTTFAQVQTYQFAPVGDTGYGEGGIWRVSAGKAGRLILEESDQWIDIRLINTANGAVLATQSSEYAGDGEADPLGRYYYHSEMLSSTDSLTRYDLSADTFVRMQPTGNASAGTVVMIPDGSRLAVGTKVFDPGLVLQYTLPANVLAATLHGDLMFTSNKAYNGITGLEMATLPANTTVMAVSGDQKKLYQFPANSAAFQTVALSTIAPLPSRSLTPSIADGATVIGTTQELGWSIEPVALSYDVYFGTSAAAVAAATKTSPEYLGNTVGSRWTGAMPPLGLASDYFWRVDVVAFSGTAKGNVWSFGIAPLEIEPRKLSVVLPANAPPQTLDLQVGGPAGATWTVSESTSWLSLTSSGGTVPDLQKVTINPSGMTAGIHTASLRFQAAGDAWDLPVSLEVIALNYTHVAADLDLPRIYAISQPSSGTDDRAFLVVFDTATNQVVKVVPVGRSVTSLSVHYQENRLYLTNWASGVLRALNRDTLEEVQTYQFGQAGTSSSTSGDAYVVAAGRSGRIMVEEEDQWIDSWLVDTATGNKLATFFSREGGGLFDPTGRYYYHGENNSSGAVIGKHDTDGDKITLVTSKRVESYSYYGSRLVAMSGDGSRVFWNGGVFDANLNVLMQLNEEVVTSTYRGELLFTNTRAVNGSNSQVLATLPVDTKVQAVSGDQKKLFLFKNAAVSVVDVSSIANVQPRGLIPGIADKAVVIGTSQELNWSQEASALSYDVYFGTSAAALAAATKDSPEFLGNVTGTRWTGTLPDLTLGGGYFWRVDLNGFSSVTKGTVWSFQVAPVDVTPRRVELAVPAGAPVPRQTLALTSATPLAWTAASSTPWITVVTPSGTTPDTLRFDINTSGLTVGARSGSITVQSGGSTFSIPVELSIVTLNVTRLVPHPQRQVVYAINTALAGEGFSHVLELDAATAAIQRTLPIGFAPTDADLDAGSGRLYISNWGYDQTRVIDVDAWRELPPLNLGTDVYKLEITPDGRLITEEEDQWIRLDIWDAASGENLASSSNPYLSIREGDGQADPTGSYYYHSDNNSSAANVTKYDIRSNSFVEALAGPQINGSRNLILSEDGSRLFVNGKVMDKDLNLLGQMPDEVHATNRTGDLAVGPATVRWSDSATEVGKLPFSSTVAAFSSGDTHLLRYNATTRTLHSIAVSSLTDLPGPWPRPGQVIQESPARFSWSPVDGATSYRIFIAADATALQAMSSPTATVTATEYLPSTVLDFGRFYSWRVDAVTGTGVVTGKVNSFGIEFPTGPALPQFGTGSNGIVASLSDRHLLVGINGSAQLYDFDPANGKASPIQKFTLPGYYGDHNFGSAVAMDAGKASVGAYTQGSAYVFRPGAFGYWESGGPMNPPSPVSNEGFGRGLAASGNLMLVGTQGSTSSAGRVCAYLTEPDAILTQTFSASDAVSNDGFGRVIAIEGNLAVISSPGNGSSYNRLPCLYAFSRSLSTGLWTQTQKITIPGASTFDSSGQALALSGSTLATNSDDNSIVIYTRNSNGQWIQSATINRSSIANSSSYFGSGLALVGDQLFIGDPLASHNGSSGGAVFSFRRSGAAWIAGPVIAASGSRSSFGAALSARDHWLAVAGGSSQPAWVYQVGATQNRTPRFASKIPHQVVAGRDFSLPVTAEDADGNSGLLIDKLQGPAWLTVTDNGNGQALLAGTPTGASGNVQTVQLRVRDNAGAEALHAYRLTLLSPTDLPVLGQSPQPANLGVGQELVLNVSVSGIGPFQWQWFKDGQAIDGATDSTYIIGEVGLGNAGQYHVRVSNVVGPVESAAVTVNVRPADRYAGDWPTFGGSPAHTGRHPAALYYTHFLPAWSDQVQTGSILNRAAIANGRAVVVPQSRFATGISVKGLDLTTGAALWSFPVPSSNSTNPPSIHQDKVYFQRGKGTGGGDTPQLYGLNATTGQQLWASTFGAQWESYEAPAVSDAGIFINGGTYGGMYGFNFDGSQRFFQGLAQYDDWTPTLANGRLFSWVAGVFTEHNLNDGSVLWSVDGGWDWNGWSMNTVSAVSGNSAALISTTELLCVDLPTRSIRWRVPGSYRGSPGIAEGRVFAIQGNAVRSHSLVDGSPGIIYQTDATGSQLVDQPILFNDRLIISNETKTWIFNLEDGMLLQTLNVGGRLSYSEGYLLAAGNDGTLRAFAALNYNAKLSSLGLSPVGYLPDFDALTTRYIATVPFDTENVTITPATEFPKATVTINGAPSPNGSASAPLALQVGENEIQTLVTAEDGITTMTYTVAVTRLPQQFVFTSANDIPVTANGFQTGGFPVDIRLDYAPVPGATLTMVNNTGLAFIHGRFSNLAHGQRIWLPYDGGLYPFVANYHGGTGNDLVLQWAGTRVAAWGLNNYGQLGDGSTTQRLRPVAANHAGMLADKTIFAVSTGYLHSVALCSDGTLASWGYNVQGQLGDNGTSNSNVPVAVDSSGVLADKTVVAIASGSYHTLALCSDGTVAAWGFNNHGQLGNGTTTTAGSPVLVKTDGALAGKQVVAIAAGAYQSYALCSDGTLAAWGYNDEGELGNGTTTGSLVPVAVDVTGALAGRKVSAIAAGQYHVLALCTDGTLVSWGYNQRGQLGNSGTVQSTSPVAIESSGALAGKTVKAIAAGASHSVALCSDGTLATWGFNSQGQLGMAGSTQSTTPLALTPPARPIAALSSGANHNLLRFADGGMAAWGANANGQLGSNSTQSGAGLVNVNTGALDHGGFIMFGASACASSHNLAVFAAPVEVPVGVEAWRLENFADMAMGAALAEDCADCDGDGMPNIVEYAFGFDPRVHCGGNPPQPQLNDNHIEIRFSRSLVPSDVDCGVEWSPDLSPGGWRDVPDTGNADEYLFRVPMNNLPRLFLRHKVSLRDK